YADGGQPFVFDANTVKDRAVPAQSDPSRIYAVNGDITGITYGEILTNKQIVAGTTINIVSYQAARPLRMLAGGDIVDTMG
ncbi:hypothetical protein NQ222_25515, partial [Escherichia coli]|nr:hypothetical protein [Escherichia coli]